MIHKLFSLACFAPPSQPHFFCARQWGFCKHINISPKSQILQFSLLKTLNENFATLHFNQDRLISPVLNLQKKNGHLFPPMVVKAHMKHTSKAAEVIKRQRKARSIARAKDGFFRCLQGASRTGEVHRHPTVEGTPPKTNMEHENHPLEKEKHLPNLHFWVPC